MVRKDPLKLLICEWAFLVPSILIWFGSLTSTINNVFVVTKVEAVVKDAGDVTPVKRSRESRKPRRNVIRVHSENIASRRFWIDQSCLLKEFGLFSEDFNKTKSEYVKSFQYENPLMLSTWIVVRVDGCHFHR